MKNDYTAGAIFLAAIVIIALIIIGPLLILWSLMHLKDVLLGVEEVYSVWSWLAIVVFFGAWRANVSVKSKS